LFRLKADCFGLRVKKPSLGTGEFRFHFDPLALHLQPVADYHSVNQAAESARVNGPLPECRRNGQQQTQRQ
jgi:hypothetical protein